MSDGTARGPPAVSCNAEDDGERDPTEGSRHGRVDDGVLGREQDRGRENSGNGAVPRHEFRLNDATPAKTLPEPSSPALIADSNRTASAWRPSAIAKNATGPNANPPRAAGHRSEDPPPAVAVPERRAYREHA